MKLTISKKTVRSIILVLSAVMLEQMFYLVDVEKINIMGFLTYYYIWMLLFIAFLGITYFLHRQWKSKVTYHFGLEIILMTILVFIQALRGCITYGQSFLDGIKVQGCFLVIVLSYFPIRKLYLNHLIEDKVIDKSLVVFGLIAFTIYLIQVILGDSTPFLYVLMSERYESLRIYVDSIFCVLLGFYGMNRFLRTKKWTGLILVALTVIYELFISKGRLEFAAFSASLVIGLILMKKYKTKKLMAILVTICLIFAFLNNPFVSEKVAEVLNEFFNNTGTMIYRDRGRDMYSIKLLSSVEAMVFGFGYPGTESALNMTGHDKGYLLADNGMFAFAYVYGIVGIVVIIMWFLKMLKMAWKLYKRQDEYIYITFLVFNIGLMYNIIFWWWKNAWTLAMIIMMCKMEYYLYDKPGENKTKSIVRKCV